MKNKRKPSKTLRRSVALPQQLVEEVTSVAGPELRNNMNRLVIVALKEFIARRKEEAFERQMAAMASDPEIAAISEAITHDFAAAERDGLQD